MKIFFAEVMQFCSSKKYFSAAPETPRPKFLHRNFGKSAIFGRKLALFGLGGLAEYPRAQNWFKMYFMTLNDPNKQSRSIPSMCTHQAHPSWVEISAYDPLKGSFYQKFRIF